MTMDLSKPLRFVALGTDVFVWVSSVIVTGIVSWFLKKYPDRSVHIVYQECIATITLGIWSVTMFLPLFKSYKGYMLPVNLIFSYLWLTSFIFSAQDWTDNRCRFVGPGFGHCGLKRTVAAFNFFAMFFLFANIFVDGYLLRPQVDKAAPADVEKTRPSVSTADTTTHAPAAAAGQNEAV